MEYNTIKAKNIKSLIYQNIYKEIKLIEVEKREPQDESDDVLLFYEMKLIIKGINLTIHFLKTKENKKWEIFGIEIIDLKLNIEVDWKI